MPESNRTDELKLQVKRELERSILITPEDREFWLSNLETLPIHTLQNLIKILKPKNDATDEMIETALSQDKAEEHLNALRADVARIKQHARGLEEKSGKKSEEKEEEELLKQLDDQN